MVQNTKASPIESRAKEKHWTCRKKNNNDYDFVRLVLTLKKIYKSISRMQRQSMQNKTNENIHILQYLKSKVLKKINTQRIR